MMRTSHCFLAPSRQARQENGFRVTQDLFSRQAAKPAKRTVSGLHKTNSNPVAVSLVFPIL